MPTVPNAVWLAMILLAVSLLAVSTLARSRGQMMAMKTKHAVTQNRLTAAQNANDELKAQTQQLRTNARAVAQAAQTQLHLVKSNEIVIATR
ncbi:MAG: septum formation initiator family protein [Acidobacteria bacterium]|nr:septum formation initiator family protein [Acidobacteriota bacterium]MBI3421891.1 septum formation initiator family protein [Acidobacteriota bacterium]